MMTKRTFKAVILAAAFAGVSLAPSAFAQAPTLADFPPSTKTGLTFTNDIAPIFTANCMPCHSSKNPRGNPSGGLRLDSLDAVLKGGKDGKVVTVSKSDDSDIVKDVAYIGDSPMPPKPRAPRGGAGTNTPPATPPASKQLTKEQVGLIRAWIDQGAK
jgi:mono/diheme cytochrome c family protein